MIVLKENQRLYLHSCNYNMARMMSALANLVKEHGGRVKPTRQALISDRNCKDAEPIKVTHTLVLCQDLVQVKMRFIVNFMKELFGCFPDIRPSGQPVERNPHTVGNGDHGVI